MALRDAMSTRPEREAVGIDDRAATPNRARESAISRRQSDGASLWGEDTNGDGLRSAGDAQPEAVSPPWGQEYGATHAGRARAEPPGTVAAWGPVA
jgi:hypothetical protein